MPRIGAPPEEVLMRIHEAGGLASLAHPGLVGRDEWIDGFGAAGIDALEAYHTDHDAETTARYLKIAERMGLAVTGGSDYHADDTHGAMAPGAVSLPRTHYDRLRATRRATASGDTTSS